MLTTYQVTGSRPYRGHRPGEEFTARLDEGPERRALLRGNIRVVERFVPALPPEHSLPPDWAERSTTTTERDGDGD